MKLISAVLFVLGAAVSPVRSAVVQRTSWSGRTLAFISKSNTIQPPMRRPSEFSSEGDPVPPALMFGRRARIAGVIRGQSETYLVVDMLDTKERFYFYYGGIYRELPSPPEGTELLDVQSSPKKTLLEASAVPKPPKKKQQTGRRTKFASAPKPSTPNSDRDAGNALGIIAVLAGLAVLMSKWGAKKEPAPVEPESNGEQIPVVQERRPIRGPEIGPPPEREAIRGPEIRLIPAQDAIRGPEIRPLGVRFTIPSRPRSYGYRVTDFNGDDFWKGTAQPFRVGKYEIGGMIYAGSGLGSIDASGPEPALIDPKLDVADGIDESSTRRLSYWPSYSGSSPDARAAYLRWLATGRKDPTADAGYVFLFFYGLERRALYDAKSSEHAAAEIPAIEQEVERLLAIYSNHSFQHYARSFLEYLRCTRKLSDRLYNGPPPNLPGRYLSFSHRVGLAQCSADDQPLPASWAYAWLLGDISTRLRTPARRCPEEFKQLFIHEYGKKFGAGLKLPRNKTELRLDYGPASASFGMHRSELGMKLELPDVSTLSSPVKKLQTIAEDCYSALESYSRAVGKDRERTGSFEAIVQLPAALWPDSPRMAFEKARGLVEKNEGIALLRFSELRSWFPDWKEARREEFEAVCRAFGSSGIGVEPDPRFGGALPEDGSTVALFSGESTELTPKKDSHYAVASLTLHLAVAVAWADGSVQEAEQTFILKQLQGWLDLSAPARARLNALVRRLLAEPPKLTGLKSRIAELSKPAKESLGQFLALVAQADHQVTPGEVKTLEKIFKLLGLDAKTVYSDVHSAALEPISVRAADQAAKEFKIPRPLAGNSKSFKIDPAKVAALKADSEKVSAILSSIFVEDQPQTEVTVVKPAEPVAEPNKDSLLGLDADHSAFLRVLAARSKWSRAELVEIAQDHGLLVDGAMERINDASFEKFNNPFFEGDDPIDLNADILKEIADDTHQAA